MGAEGSRGRKADEYRIAGKGGEAAKFDNLAKIALTKQIASEKEAKDAEPMIQSQEEVVAKLKTGLDQMRAKLDELKNKRDQLIARAKTAEAQNKVQDAIASINVLDPTSELGRYEEQVRRQEALAMGKSEVAVSSLEAQFAELEDHSQDLEVEARLAALKSGEQPAQIESRDFTAY